MISKYSKQMQISSNKVIYFSSENLTWTKRKGHTVHIKTEAKKHTYSKSKNIFCKSTALQSIDR